MTEWNSVEELVQELAVGVDPNRPEEVQKAIRKKLSSLQPDKTEGEFPTKESREQYEKLLRALEFARRNADLAKALVIRNSELPELLETIRELVSRPAKPDVDSLRRSCRANVNSEREARFSFRLRTCGLSALVTGALLTFSQVFGSLFKSDIASGLLVAVFIVSRGWWLLNWFIERREKEMGDYFLSETNRKEILIWTLPNRNEVKDGQVYFELADVVQRLSWLQRRRIEQFQEKLHWKKLKIPEIVLGELDRIELKQIAKVIVAELRAQGVAEISSEKRLVPRHAIARSVPKPLHASNDYSELIRALPQLTYAHCPELSLEAVNHETKIW